MLTAITGINWGDEGKGRMVDLISQEYDIVARYQGGNNAGHTVKNERGKFVLNLLPSGILRPNVVCVMGNGMVIDPHHLDGEINKLREQGIAITPDNLKISDRATITMPYHVDQDGLEEARLAKTGAQFGSTKRGIAYTYGDKYMKKTLRMGDLLHLDDSCEEAPGDHGGFQEPGDGGQLPRRPHQRGRDVGMAGEVCRHLQGLHLRRGPVSG